jgi:hypothetical protein
MVPTTAGAFTDYETIPELSMLGGPLHRLGCRVGLIKKGSNAIPLGVALGLLAWSVSMILALLAGYGDRILSLAVIGVHVRFLVAIPLFFLCETWVFPRMAGFAPYIVRTGLVLENSVPELAVDAHRVSRMNDSWTAEALLLGAAIVLPIIETVVKVPSGTGSWVWILHTAGEKPAWVYGWYLGVCLPLFRFLLLRWLWRLGLWSYFLWRVQKLRLNLIPIHSDGSGGLGCLNVVHEQFAPLVLAIAALCSAQFAEDISSGTMTPEGLYSWVPMVMLLVAAIFIGPLCMFSTKLYLCRLTGLGEYMAMASRYVNAFDRKWIRDGVISGEALLGSSDLQALSDLSKSVNVVRDMRAIPVSKRLLIEVAVCTLLPQLPLFLLKFSFNQVAARLFQVLIGL